MTKRHANDSDTLRTAISAWWDDESHDDKALEAMLDDVEQVGSRTRDYDLVGSHVRGESFETRDLLGAINARLDELPSDERPQADNVVAFPHRRLRQRRVWQGAVAASLFAAVTAVGLTLSTGEDPTGEGVAPMQAEGLTANDRAVMASLNDEAMPEDASPASLLATQSPVGHALPASSSPASTPQLPDWATGRSSTGADPYVVTHYRTAAPESGTTGPEARAATFGRE
ncbi:MULTISPECIES: RseA family anti-sigma factor [unclassified Guyparkeria]|uniref:RseA family anti-sigma factor n=1 Tax=unclassified Guyparkeria TaxID=2626246 RepID=UPI0012E3F2A4|nr:MULTISPECIES: RseA family anti-sigma factor [unclassified Guyparkeria]